MNQPFAEFLGATMHGQFGPFVAPLDDDMAGASFLGLEGAALRGQLSFEFLRDHTYNVLHRGVEVNRNVEVSG